MHSHFYGPELLPDSISTTPRKVANTATGAHYCVCTSESLVHIVEHLWSSPYVITHDLVNLTILCYDYKLCLSNIITFEK